MNGRQEVFVEEYCNNGRNATTAYKKAYPDCKKGHQQAGSRLLSSVVIQQAIRVAKGKIEAWKKGKKELCDRLFRERYEACVAKKDNTNAIRCIENKAKNVGYYAEDNLQRAEQVKLDQAEATESQRIANILNLEDARKGKFA